MSEGTLFGIASTGHRKAIMFGEFHIPFGDDPYVHSFPRRPQGIDHSLASLGACVTVQRTVFPWVPFVVLHMSSSGRFTSNPGSSEKLALNNRSKFRKHMVFGLGC